MNNIVNYCIAHFIAFIMVIVTAIIPLMYFNYCVQYFQKMLVTLISLVGVA